MNTIRLLVVTSIRLVSCGGSSDEPSAADPSAEAEPRPTVFDPLTDTLDRAAGVEDTLRDSAAERRRQLEEAEGR
jgi:hypothetical protein